MKSIFKWILPALLIAAGTLLLGTCSGGGAKDTSTISISMSEAVSKAVSIDQLRHVITLQGPSGKQTLTISGKGTAKATVVPGLWRIDAEGFLGDELYSKGSASADVRAGQNVNVSIQMIIVWAVGGGGGGSSNTGGNTPAPVFQDGSAAYPWLVDSVATLEKVGSGIDGWDLDKCYMQTADIDMTGVTGFQPIGNSFSAPFTGVYDGNGKSIKSYTNNPSLFGYILGTGVTTTTGIARNISLINCRWDFKLIKLTNTRIL